MKILSRLYFKILLIVAVPFLMMCFIIWPLYWIITDRNIMENATNFIDKLKPKQYRYESIDYRIRHTADN